MEKFIQAFALLFAPFTAAFGSDDLSRFTEGQFREMRGYYPHGPIEKTPDCFGDCTVNCRCTPFRVMTEEDGLPAEYREAVQLLGFIAQGEGKLFPDVIDSVGQSLKSLHLLCPSPGSEDTLNVPNHIKQAIYTPGTLDKLLSDLNKLIDADRHLHIDAFFEKEGKKKYGMIGIHEEGTPRCLVMEHGLDILQKLEHTRRDLLDRVPIHLTEGGSLGDKYLKDPEEFLRSLGVVNTDPRPLPGDRDRHHYVNPYRRFGFIAKHSVAMATQLLKLSPKDASVLDKVSRRYISMLCLSQIVKELDDLNNYYQELSEPEKVEERTAVGSKLFKDVLEERGTVSYDVLRFVAESLSDIVEHHDTSVTETGEVSVTATAAYSDGPTATGEE